MVKPPRRQQRVEQAHAIDVEEVIATLMLSQRMFLDAGQCEAIEGVIRLFHSLLPRFRISETRAALLCAQQTKLTNSDEEETGDGISATPSGSEPQRKQRRGHGRNGAVAFTGATRVLVTHPVLKHGSTCPECVEANVSRTKKPCVLFRFTAQPPVEATRYDLDRFRCNLCGATFVAPPPADMPEKKWDATVSALLSVLTYGAGMTLYRIEQLQKAVGVPLPASTQWGLLEEATQTLKPVLEALRDEAAQAPQFYNDDTSMRIVKMKRPEGDTRTGIRTSAILAELDGNLRIALFETGRQIAGESLAEILTRRKDGLKPARLMCDGLEHNIPKGDAVPKLVILNCLVHARRYFVNILNNFPAECHFVLDELAKVYHFDDEARQRQMTSEQRLAHHQAFSTPVMGGLKKWMEKLQAEQGAEPNSGLGRAIRYCLNRWEKLTRFLDTAGAPLDNNICEREMKTPILHRKNSLFYLTNNGAMVGDLHMSLIHTCRLNNVDPFRYLTVLLKREHDVAKSPRDWLPWNYQATLDRLERVAELPEGLAA